MSLEEKIKNILNNFDSSSSEEIVAVLNEIKPQFKSELTSEYLQGKIQKVLDTSDESERKTQCKALTPYLDWYVQGL